MEEEEEMFTPSECSSECSSELEEMFNAPSEMPEEQSVTELAHDDVGIIEKSSVSPKNREGMPTGSGILDEYSTSSPSVDNRLPEANTADEISPPPHAVEPLSLEASKDSEDLNQLDILKGPTAHDDVGIKEMLYGCSTSPLVDNRLPEANIADKPLSPEASKGSEDLNQLDIQKGQTAVAEGPLFQIMKIVSDQENEVEECKHLAGHEGNHDCKMKNHTCAEICSLFDKSSNCSKSCCLTVGHEGTHKCNSSQHLCNMKCSLPSCKNPCVIQIELGDHDKHACHERFCPKDYIMEGCPRSCGYKDHFHELTSDEHLCGEKHGCPKECEADGICEILTELVRHRRSFEGRRGSFEYIHLSEQNGKKKNCCIDIPPFKTSHDGVHLHTQNPDVVHHCNARCQACGYFCQKPIDHTGLHNTVHGNMRNANFASDQEEFDIQGRKYAWGESSVAEMCNLHCKAQGRGHIHLIPCPINDGLPCTSHIYDGSRHETRKYGPDLDVPKDKLTHETYWLKMRFEDPCTEEDQREFTLSNHLCRSEEHKDTDGSSTKSYCAEKLWHAPVQRTSTPSSGGYITADGHRFLCDHLKDGACMR